MRYEEVYSLGTALRDLVDTAKRAELAKFTLLDALNKTNKANTMLRKEVVEAIKLLS